MDKVLFLVVHFHMDFVLRIEYERDEIIHARVYVSDSCENTVN